MNLYNTFESGKLEKKMNVISDLAYYACMNNNLLLIQQLFKQTLTHFFKIPLLWANTLYWKCTLSNMIMKFIEKIFKHLGVSPWFLGKCNYLKICKAFENPLHYIIMSLLWLCKSTLIKLPYLSNCIYQTNEIHSRMSIMHKLIFKKSNH